MKVRQLPRQSDAFCSEERTSEVPKDDERYFW